MKPSSIYRHLCVCIGGGIKEGFCLFLCMSLCVGSCDFFFRVFSSARQKGGGGRDVTNAKKELPCF